MKGKPYNNPRSKQSPQGDYQLALHRKRGEEQECGSLQALWFGATALQCTAHPSWQSPRPKSAGEIKDVMLDKSPDLTRIIDKLEKGGLVNRKTCPGNRRKVDITIAKKGLGSYNWKKLVP
ncbi:MAG: MarR family transcriptional regulator [Bacteroidia bacterium]